MREDIITALCNAIERGESLEQAKYTLVMAGYPRQEVEQAANFVYAKQEKGIVVPEGIVKKKPSSEKITSFSAKKGNITSAERSLVESKDMKNRSQKIGEGKFRKKDKKILVLIIIASFLSLVTLLLIIFRNKILELLFG